MFFSIKENDGLSQENKPKATTCSLHASSSHWTSIIWLRWTNSGPRNCLLPYSVCYLVSSKLISDCFLLKQNCPICLTNRKDVAFGCGHMVSYTLRPVTVSFKTRTSLLRFATFLFADLWRVWIQDIKLPHLQSTDHKPAKALHVISLCLCT